MKPLFIIGSGGFSKQVIEMVEEINYVTHNYDIKGIIDDNLELNGKRVLNHMVIGNTDYLDKLSKINKVYAVIAIGDGYARETINNKLKNVNWINLIHPKTIISRYLDIGVGNIICSGVIINPDCKIGNHCNINIASTLGHDVILEDYVTIMPGCNISGNVNIKRNSMIGTGSCIIQNRIIGSSSIIGAGTVVIKDVNEKTLIMGNPAKVIKK